MRLPTFIAVFLFLHFSFAQNFGVSSISKELLDNADAVVRLNSTNIVVSARDQMTVSEHRVVTVLNEKGDRHVQAYAFYEKNYKISNLLAIVYNAQGEEIKKVKKKDFLDQSAIDGGTLYSDSRVLLLNYTPVQYPYTVEFVNEYTTPNTAFVPHFNFLENYRVSSEKSDFSFKVDCGIPFRHKASNLEEYQVELSLESNAIRCEANNLKAIQSEPLSPMFNEFTPNIKVALESFHLEGVDGVAKTWEELGQWMYDELLVGQDNLDEETIEKVKALVKDVDDPLEKVSRVYKYVQENTRYISVQLGIGGWMPISAVEVDRVKYGDCKGLTNYTKALLSAVGIESFYTVVYGGNIARSLDKDIPSMQGNHVFLNVPLPDQEVWLECTSQTTPVNFLGTFTDNRDVLKVTPNGGQFVRTRASLDEDNYQFTKAECSISEDRKIIGKVTIISKGTQYDQKYWRTTDSRKEQEEFYKNYWNYVNNLSLGKVNFTNNDREIEFVEEIDVSAEGYLSTADEKFLFSPNVYNRNLAVPDRSRNRKTPVVISRGYLDEDEFTIHLPEGYVPETWMLPVQLENKFGSYSISITPDEKGFILYKRKLLIKSGTYPKEDYEDYREFRKKVARYDNAKIVLIKKST
jgi:Transglutaminase-like enzymes, putative cysteine proteases